MKEFDVENSRWWTYALLLLGGTAFFLLLYALCQSAMFSVPERFVIPSGFVLGAALLGLYVLSLHILGKHWPSSSELFRMPLGITRGFIIGVLYFVATTSLIALSGCYRISCVSYYKSFISQVSFFFMVACGEEVVFRGVLFRLIDRKWGFAVALSVSAVLFGGMHILNDGATLWSSAAIAIEAGLMLGVAYKCSGTLSLPIGIHWSWNLMEGPVLGFPVSGEGIGQSIITPQIQGPDIITGGEFGPEASIYASILGLAVTLIILHFYNQRRSQTF